MLMITAVSDNIQLKVYYNVSSQSIPLQLLKLNGNEIFSLNLHETFCLFDTYGEINYPFDIDRLEYRWCNQELI